MKDDLVTIDEKFVECGVRTSVTENIADVNCQFSLFGFRKFRCVPHEFQSLSGFMFHEFQSLSGFMLSQSRMISIGTS